ncbi:hypothetical protein PVAND_014784 [Polypedilum vanderplanki]|uniref:C2H2-type domain-containing protein n=1 Tax=Polypedilum vanderplanki TaxID=319348 RepID=A0A9J6BB03_POLVA|nr:hypothetical protein PVAND_014784 [Polypedilum vanderplanki]
MTSPTLQGAALLKEMEELSRKRKSKDDSSPSPPQQGVPNLDIFNCFNVTNPSPLNMFSPQFLANQTAAAVALMAWPIQLRAQLASTLRLPNHPLMNWPSTDISKLNKVFKNQNSEAQIVSTTSDLPTQKKIAKRKQQPENIRKLEPLKISEKFVPTLLSPTESNSEISTCSSNSKETTKQDKIFTCQICNRSFGYKHVLQNHERTHTGEKPFECSECHKRFTRDHHLKTHMRLHTGEKPYSCSHCDRQFVQVANLRRHLRVHTGERPYNCDICESRFSDSNQLKAHIMSHSSSEKPFECEKCNVRFRKREHLINHKCGSPLNENSDDSIELAATNINLVNDGLLKPPLKKFCNFPSAFLGLPLQIPEQTEPEDLSMHTPRSNLSNDDFEELDDAAAMYLKLKQRQLEKSAIEALTK